MRRKVATAALAIAVAGLALLAWMMAEAAQMPVVRALALTVRHWPAGVAPVRLVLLTDSHVSGPDGSPARLRRIVARVNALRPDIVLLGGDYVSTAKLRTRRYTVAEAIAPFAGLRARLGSVAVLGNHDHWLDPAAVRAALRGAGVRVLSNEAVRMGPIAMGGVDDAFTGHALPEIAAAAMRRVGGVPVLLSHSPDVFAGADPAIPLVLAGHTHCGQVDFPVLGPPWIPSKFGNRYDCGIKREHGATLVVSAGVGTSELPVRLRVPPDLWVVNVGPQPASRMASGRAR